MIAWQVGDLVAQTSERLHAQGIDSVAAVRQAPRLIVTAPELAELKSQLERFLFDRVYRHERVLTVREQAQAELREMFERFVARPERLPPSFEARICIAGLERTVGDYIAGMTDRFARREYERIVKGERGEARGES
jgi:dGTPase